MSVVCAYLGTEAFVIPVSGAEEKGAGEKGMVEVNLQTIKFGNTVDVG